MVIGTAKKTTITFNHLMSNIKRLRSCIYSNTNNVCSLDILLWVKDMSGLYIYKKVSQNYKLYTKIKCFANSMHESHCVEDSSVDDR